MPGVGVDLDSACSKAVSQSTTLGQLFLGIRHIFCIDVAIGDQAHDVKSVFLLCNLLAASGNSV